jgi:hypothetical protein
VTQQTEALILLGRVRQGDVYATLALIARIEERGDADSARELRRQARAGCSPALLASRVLVGMRRAGLLSPEIGMRDVGG